MILVLQVLMNCAYGDMKPTEPELELKKNIDLGLILDTTAPVELFIPIKNVSKRTITILKMSKDCSCISVTIDKRKLEPGETATVRYSANILGRTDRFASEIVIESDASERIDEIQIRGQITGQIRVRPRSVTVLTGEQESSGSFTVFSDDQDGKWNYTGFVADNPSLRVDLRQESSSPTTSTYSGTVTLAPDWSKGSKISYCSSGITLKFRNNQLERDLNIRVSVEIAVRRKLTVDPISVSFLANAEGQTRSFLVQSVQTLSIDAARCESPCISATIHPIDLKVLRVDLIYHPARGQESSAQNVVCELISQGTVVRSVPINFISFP